MLGEGQISTLTSKSAKALKAQERFECPFAASSLVC